MNIPKPKPQDDGADDSDPREDIKLVENAREQPDDGASGYQQPGSAS